MKSSTVLIADGFKIPFKNEVTFDIVHIDMVLHHLIGKNRSESFRLSKKMLDIISHTLSNNGKIIVEEYEYLSYLIPSFTSSMIFYGLKFLNKLGINFNKISNEIQFGLEVNFFNQKQLKNLLSKYGEVELISKRSDKVSLGKQFFLLKEFSTVSYLITK